jgi:hypothetical protein
MFPDSGNISFKLIHYEKVNNYHFTVRYDKSAYYAWYGKEPDIFEYQIIC